MEGSVVADQKMFKTFLLLNTQILDPEQNAACREFSKKKKNKQIKTRRPQLQNTASHHCAELISLKRLALTTQFSDLEISSTEAVQELWVEN